MWSDKMDFCEENYLESKLSTTDKGDDIYFDRITQR